MPHLAHLNLELSPFNATAEVLSAHAGVLQMRPSRSKVAIVGAGYGRQYAPYEDNDWEVWGLNAVPSRDERGRLRADRWFEMHIMAAQNANDMKWIHECPFPIYLVPSASDWKQSEHNPKQIRYPIELIEEKFGCYFACSFAYQIALALHERFTDIGLYGCELAYGTERERTLEFACVSWWIGLAEGLGTTIHLPPHSTLGHHKYRYGIEYWEEKRDVEQYVDLMRKGDRERNVDLATPYDSAREFSQGG